VVSLHRTPLSEKMLPISFVFTDSPLLAGLFEVRLVSGSEDWLSGRYIDSRWDLDELVKEKEDIIKYDALKNRLTLPPAYL
jgi:hypothetical protein